MPAHVDAAPYFHTRALDAPFFSTASGASATSLQEQAFLLFCAAHNASQTFAHQLTGKNRKMIANAYMRNDECRRVDVEREEPEIRYGGNWEDVEVDEVDVSGNAVRTDDGSPAPPDADVVWEQWGGIIQRGAPESLTLFRLDPKLTAKRSPGPGPIRLTDWAPLAKNTLKTGRLCCTLTARAPTSSKCLEFFTTT